VFTLERNNSTSLQTNLVLMKNVFLIVSIMIFSVSFLQAQTGDLLMKSSNKGLYVEHKVAAKENFYSIGRAFNVHPKHLASFNSLNMSKGLSLGQTIKIPLSDSNFNRKTDKGLPVYYVTANGETIYNVSTNNNVLMDRLRKWNKISSDKLPSGSKLIIGFLSNEIPAVAATNPQKTETVNKIQDKPVKDAAKNENVNKPEPKKEEIKQQESKQNNETVAVKEEVKSQQLGPGYFKLSFDQQIKKQPISNDQTVTSGIFKTSSGWSDAKYYLLMNGADPGSIIKITNPSNNKTIYAKLLGGMIGLKQNEGLNIRISNAAADALEISETDKFIVKLNY
jgi:LysM repeat protein